MSKEIKEKCKECVYYNEGMEYPKINGTTTHSNCMSIKCDYRKATKDLKIIRLNIKISDLEAKLAEKEKEIAVLQEQDEVYHNQLAISELEKVVKFIKEYPHEPRYWDIASYIDQQIKNLRSK